MLNNETTQIIPAKRDNDIEISALISPSAEVMRALAAIYVECFNGYPWFENWDAEMAETTLRGYLEKQNTILVARNCGEVVGFSVASRLTQIQDSARYADILDVDAATYLSDVAVAPNSQGCGIGTKLVQGFIQLSRSQGAQYATLRTRENNFSAIHVFEKLGFKECLRYQAETGGVESSRIGFQLPLK